MHGILRYVPFILKVNNVLISSNYPLDVQNLQIRNTILFAITVKMNGYGHGGLVCYGSGTGGLRL